jgi:leucyl/phenylalanyl-tRNA--protein transferase
VTIEFIPPGADRFPDPARAGADGLLAFGGDLAPGRLLRAYSQGIFPWYGPGDPILWWSPDPRCVLPPEALHVPRSLGRTLRRRTYAVTVDRAFARVIRACAETPRRGSQGTWLVPEMIEAYQRLHALGAAHSVEAWAADGTLAGGVYGVALGRVFFGESMFHTAPDASKAAFVVLARLLARWGYGLIDCQQTTRHMLRFGAFEMPRARFLTRLAILRTHPPAPDAWTLPEGFAASG